MKKILIRSIFLGFSFLSMSVSVNAATSAYEPHSSVGANRLGTTVRIENILNDYSITVPIEYKWTDESNTELDYRGLSTSSNIYAKFDENAIYTAGPILGIDEGAMPIVTTGISKPVYLPEVPATIPFEDTILYYHYYVVGVTDRSNLDEIGNNYAMEVGDMIPTNATFAWAYYAESPRIDMIYQTTTGELLDKTTTYVGELGDFAPFNQKSFSGYSLVAVPENVPFTLDKQTVVFTYEKNKAADVTVRYVDTEGNSIHKEQIISGEWDDKYDATTDQYKLTLPGYTLDKEQLPVNAMGKLTEETQVVTYVYQKNNVLQQIVTIKYQDQNGKEIHDSQIISGDIGSSFDVSTSKYKLVIDGYQLDATKLPKNAHGKFIEESQVVVYFYSKVSIPDEVIIKSDKKPETSETVKEVSEIQKNDPRDKKIQQLPKTGQRQSLLTALSGMTIIMFSFVFLYRFKRN